MWNSECIIKMLQQSTSEMYFLHMIHEGVVFHWDTAAMTSRIKKRQQSKIIGNLITMIRIYMQKQ